MIPGPNLGQIGLVPDQPPQKIPLGGWERGFNIRFKSGYMSRIKEPSLSIDTEPAQAGEWMVLYEDGTTGRQIYASEGKLYRLNLASTAWEDVTNSTIVTYSAGTWQGFQFGTSVIMNNGVDPPQILYAGATEFKTIPNWGLVTVGGGQVQKTVTCASIRPYGDYLVAMDVTIDGTRSQNAVWTSAPAIIDNVTDDSEMPSWDYADPAVLATLNYIGVEYGPVIDGLKLNNYFFVYTRESAHIFQLVGGQFVFANRQVLPYGIACLGALASFDNYHLCVGPASIYAHDGSMRKEIADNRISDDFYANLASVDTIRCEENLDTREIHILFDSFVGKQYLIYNYDESLFSMGQATVNGEDVVCMAYGFAPTGESESYDTITTTYETEDRTYDQMASESKIRRMFWLTAGSVYLAEDNYAFDSQKEYFVERFGWDFSELSPEMTTNKIKSLETIIPHIQGTASTRFTISSSETLGTDAQIQEILDYDPATDYKIDPRISGRWLGFRIDVTSEGQWEMSSMDYDMKAVHGR